MGSSDQPLLTAVLGVAPSFTGLASIGYGIFAGVLGLIFIACSISVLRMPEGDERMVPARKMFGYSIFYLFIIFSALLADHAAAGVATLIGSLL